MSDAIQVSNVDKLEPEMRTVFTMFERAANAIVRASDLGREVSKLTGEVSHLTEAYANVDGIRQAHEAQIGRLESDASHWHLIADQRQETIIERSGEIERLKADNSQLRRVLEMTTRQYDEVCEARDKYFHGLDHMTTQYNEAETKLKKFREILGLPEVAGVGVDPAKPGSDQTAVAQVIDRPSNGNMESTRNHGSAPLAEPIHDTASDVKSEPWSPPAQPKPDYSDVLQEPASHTEDFTQKPEGGPDASVGKYEYLANFRQDPPQF